MKKTFVTLATVTALVAAAAPVLAIEWEVPKAEYKSDNKENPMTEAVITQGIANQIVEESKPAPTYAEENNNPGNPGEEEFVTVEIPVDVDGDGKTDRIDVKRVSTGVWVNKGEEAKTEEAKTEEAKTEEAKPAAKPVAAVKTATGAKTLPKTSAAK
ncbi:hypothetical protein HO908_10925 [Streptococcus suis]|nr:hypothetical protein [Streptococcus suis]